MLAHNHPTGRATPSPEDYALTERLVAAGKLLGIEVVDHLVVAGDAYCSVLHGDRSASRAASPRKTRY